MQSERSSEGKTPSSAAAEAKLCPVCRHTSTAGQQQALPPQLHIPEASW